METFRTGQPAPSTEMYSFAGHKEGNSSCQPNEEERKIPLVAGEIFRLADTMIMMHIGIPNPP